MTLLHPRLMWLNGELHRGKAVELADGRVRSIGAVNKTLRPDHRPYLVMPACTDLQVNGSGGVMFTGQPDVDALHTILATQRARGTGWILPTLLYADLNSMRAAANAVLHARDVPGLLGIHFVGPYVNPLQAPVFGSDAVRGFDREMLGIVSLLRRAGLSVMLTLAPECVSAEVIGQLAAMGAVVSAGQTNATAEQASLGISAGVTCFTHLFNGMPPMTSRAPGVVAAALNSDAYCSVIMDGKHVDWQMLQMVANVRSAEKRLFIVSDGMATVGGPDQFDLDGAHFRLKDGFLTDPAGRLAGGHVDLVSSLRNAVEYVGIPLAKAVAMCTDIPHHVLGLVPPQIQHGRDVDEVLALDDDLRRIEI